MPVHGEEERLVRLAGRLQAPALKQRREPADQPVVSRHGPKEVVVPAVAKHVNVAVPLASAGFDNPLLMVAGTVRGVQAKQRHQKIRPRPLEVLPGIRPDLKGGREERRCDDSSGSICQDSKSASFKVDYVSLLCVIFC